MSVKSPIEWLAGGDTWNPVRARNLKTGKVGWFCEHASDLCRFCYAEAMNNWIGTGLAFKPIHLKDVEIFLDEKILMQPLRSKRGRLIFPCSMTDLFGRWVTDAMLDRIFAVMALAPQHTFLCLTKRPQRMTEYLSKPAPESTRQVIGLEALRMCLDAKAARRESTLGAGVKMCGEAGREGELVKWPLPNAWMGYSGADEAGVRALLKTPAAVRWLSLEPLLSGTAANDLQGYYLQTAGGEYPFGSILPERNRTRLLDLIDWMVVGGESGRTARPCDIAWIRSLITQCRAAMVPLFVKQIGARPFDGYIPAKELVEGMRGRPRPADQPLTEEAAREILSDPLGIGPVIDVDQVPRLLPIKDPKGGDPAEWPEDLRVREYPRPVAAA
jgi:protein gp37